jgi:SAP domain-containing ribonucleoprotein
MSKVQKAANSGPEAPKTPVSVPATSVDEELERRKARAARFGIALVEPPKPKTKSTPGLAPKAVKASDVRSILFNATLW